MDWRKEGAVTHIKNQCQCGSCWAFSTTGSTEGCHKLKSKDNKLVSLSEQNLMDCSYQFGNQGCNGGLMVPAMEYIMLNGGIDTEDFYWYRGYDCDTCLYDATKSAATLSGYSNVQTRNETDLAYHAIYGPVSIAIDASHKGFAYYQSGIYYEPDCSQSQLDHGVLVVGYHPSYWIVKNSWGEGWGNGGYIDMARGSNQCGVATMATRPLC